METQDLTKQGSVRETMRFLKDQAKKLKEELKAVRAQVPKLSFGKKRVEIGDKGNILFYGLNQKFPVSLYLNQVQDIKQIINSPEFKKFLDDNKDSISIKEEKTA